jgi:formylglycine-generating enzyme required for sulfatase activity
MRVAMTWLSLAVSLVTSVPVDAGEKRCPPDAVRVGPACVDKYEASVWDIPDANIGLLNRVKAGKATADMLVAGGAVQVGVSEQAACNPVFPPSFPETGNWTQPLYAVSVPGVKPTACVTQFQAAQACRLSGKRLLSNQEWQDAAAGTPDPGTDDGVADCNVGSGYLPVATGSRVACRSSWGTYDMVGNVAEWVEGAWFPPPSTNLGCPGWGTFSDDDVCFPSPGLPGPGALFRGGRWMFGAGSGVFTVENYAPQTEGSSLGFRCGR